MKLTADQYYYVHFCMLEEPAMFKPLSYSSEFVSIRQPELFSADNASFQAKNIRAGSPNIFMSMVRTKFQHVAGKTRIWSENHLPPAVISCPAYWMIWQIASSHYKTTVYLHFCM